MTSTPTPPPNYSTVSAPRHRNRWTSNTKTAPLAVVGSSKSAGVGSGSSRAAVCRNASGRNSNGSGRAVCSSTLGSLYDGRQSRLAPEFSGRRTTRFSAKMHSGMPRVTPNKHAHSDVADETLHCLFKAGDGCLENLGKTSPKNVISQTLICDQRPRELEHVSSTHQEQQVTLVSPLQLFYHLEG
ncbi:hypothetical protein TSUD_288900 [Trifolium subterraneum]|uniref:Uncharacterized protein n=1 Tax=Trifolium subterraneum TaxID=3900 RepID=A0A2Z6MH04_TRISU|nr:hypothetical protein TSUD_288900 [Trifolium subterraneum]